MPVDAMILTQDAQTSVVVNDRHALASGLTRVYGESLHVEREALIEHRYRRFSLEDFLVYEARHSIGNYAVIDASPQFARIITSPGYCGGYVYEGTDNIVAATLLSDVIAHANEIEMDDFGLCYFLNYSPKSSFNQLPFSTMFRNLHRMPPASVLEFKKGKMVACYSYLARALQLTLPASFEAAMGEVADSLAAHYTRTKKQPALMFSGGVDSLVIYLTLRERLGAGGVRVLTMDHNESNGPPRAFPIATKLGFAIDHVASRSVRQEVLSAAAIRMMKKDIVGANAPHLAIADHPLGGVDILHGQNMDATIGVNMTVLHANFEKAYFSKAKATETLPYPGQLRQYTAFLGNLVFTDAYLNDPDFQRETISYFSKLYKNTIPDPAPGGAGILRGMLSSQFPNLLSLGRFPPNQVKNLDIEVDLFRKHVGPGHDASRMNYLARYYSYSHLANKRLSSLSLPDGSRTLLVAMSGPILSYSLARRIGLSQASNPKYEVYGLAEKLSGMPYSELIKGDQALPPRSEQALEDTLLADNISHLDPQRSQVLPAISDEKIRRHISDIYQSVLGTYKPDSENHTKYNVSRGRQILNLEFLLSAKREAKACHGLDSELNGAADAINCDAP